ncbi:helix-turn-helix transcriptional regulator [Sphingomonas sp. Leaf22]|uniref:helix-turn-helix transcriptional regulator n=1 Tax=Sphingomonas sp. Leaf22 TaxID=1735687 RepID=UPI0009EADD05|nr:AlpA family phage regulatory protein [Sphingomonas sp. Leaf22]
MQDNLLRGSTVISRTGIPRSTIYHMMKQGRFPLPVRISQRSVRWRESDIQNFIESPSRWMLDNITRSKSVDGNK